MEDMNNQVLYPGWETVRLIGRGSFGAVYEIQRELFGETEKAALKVITIPQSASDIEEMYSEGYNKEDITNTFQNHLKSIISEYTLMRKLNGSSNVVNCDDVRYIQHDDGIGWDIFIKMELLTPLNKVLSENIPEEQVLDVGRDICRALVLCKEHKIIHRDIKPQNIFVSEYGDYKLGDFGIAKTVEKTSGGTKIGTYKYMAPEVYHDEPYGASADIYSLGLVLYWMLNERRMPFLPLPPEKLSASAEENARRRRLSGDPLPAPAHGSGELKQIVLKACAYNPKDRYQSAAEMLSALENLGNPETAASAKESKAKKSPLDDAAEYAPTEGFGWKADAQDRGAETGEDTVGVWNTKPENTEKTKAAEQKEAPEEDETVNAWVKPEAVKTAPADALLSEKKPGKKKIIWTIAACLALVLIAVRIYKPGYSVLTASGAYSSLPNLEWDHIADISVGVRHVLGLKTDGTVVADSAFYIEEKDAACEVSEWTDIKAIGAGDGFSLGLKTDGTVVSAGAISPPASAMTNIKEIYVDGFFAAGLKNDGTVVVFSEGSSTANCDVSAWTDIKKIAYVDYCGIAALKENGTVVSTAEECDVSAWSNIVDIKAGYSFIAGLKSDGTVLVAQDEYGSVLDTSAWTDIVKIDSWDSGLMGLKADGTVVGVQQTDGYEREHDVSGWNDIVDIVVEWYFTLGLKSDGTVVITPHYSVSDWNNVKKIYGGWAGPVGLC